MWKTVAWNFLDAFLPRDFVENYYTWVFCEGQFKNNNKKFIAFNWDLSKFNCCSDSLVPISPTFTRESLTFVLEWNEWHRRLSVASRNPSRHNIELRSCTIFPGKLLSSLERSFWRGKEVTQEINNRTKSCTTVWCFLGRGGIKFGWCKPSCYEWGL